MFPLRYIAISALAGVVALWAHAGLEAQKAHATCVCGAAQKHWKLIWSDEFNGPNGAPPDAQKWTIVSGGSGFGNSELESYTGRPENVHQENGNLVITARKEQFTGVDAIARQYTSARLQTKDHFEPLYGRIEARIKIPAGKGLWAAFWMLGSDFDTKGWPAAGEVDIMENVGIEPGTVHGTLHGPLYSGGDALTGSYELPGEQRFSDAFHRYAIEWEPGVIRFYVDDELYETQNRGNLPAYKHWAFDHPFYLLLNLAVGGVWPGPPDAETSFPATMLVDYVRVYQEVKDDKPHRMQARR